MRLEFDREPNVTDALRWLFEGVADIYPWLEVINNKLEDILSNQDDLNTRVARLAAAVSAIATEITALQAQPGADALDWSALDAQLSALEAEEAPVAPAPVVDPTPAPVDVVTPPLN